MYLYNPEGKCFFGIKKTKNVRSSIKSCTLKEKSIDSMAENTSSKTPPLSISCKGAIKIIFDVKRKT